MPKPLRCLQITEAARNSQVLTDPREVYFLTFYLALNGHFGLVRVGEYFRRLEGISLAQLKVYYGQGNQIISARTSFEVV